MKAKKQTKEAKYKRDTGGPKDKDIDGKQKCMGCDQLMKKVWYFSIDTWYVINKIQYCRRCNVIAIANLAGQYSYQYL